MNNLYINLIILSIMIYIIIYSHFNCLRPEFFKLDNLDESYQMQPLLIPFIVYPKIYNFTNESTGYDSGSREYNNMIFANEVAQGLDT